MTPLEQTLVDVAATLDEASIPHMLIGGLAVGLWGEPRATLDVDVSIWVEPAELPQSVQSIPGFVRETNVLPPRAANGIRIDVVFGSVPIQKLAIGRAVSMPVAGANVQVASVEDLVLMKMLSTRDKDASDARQLIRRHKNRLDEAPSRTGLVRTLDAALD